MKNFSRVIIYTVSVALTGCTLSTQMNAHTAEAQRVQDQLINRQNLFKEALSSQQLKEAAQEVNRPWLAGKAKPLSREVTLPLALRENIDTTLMFAEGSANLLVLASRIERATGISVRVLPEALLPLEQFLPRLTLPGATVVPLPIKAELPLGPQPLASALDAIAGHLGVYWHYVNESIEFYRTQTREFQVRALTLSARADARLGRSGKSVAGGFENTSNTSLSVEEHDTLEAVQARIEPFLTRSGIISAQAGAGPSIVVTDTPDALDRVARFLEHENKALTRRVRLLFEEITVVKKDQTEIGIDWNAIYKAARASGSWATAGKISADSAAALSLNVGAGPYENSKAIVSALKEIGTVVRHSSVPVLTLNRRPVTHAVRTTFSYINQVQSTATHSNTSGSDNEMLPSLSVSQKEETVGSFLTLVPDAQEDGQILLSVAYDNTVAQPLKTITFGEASKQIKLQQITIEGNGTVQQVQLRPGQPMLISGFERKQDDSTARRLGENLPLIAGGINQTSQAHTTTVMIVTAQVEEGF